MREAYADYCHWHQAEATQKDLGEIVGAGYGTQERQSVMGAGASVSGCLLAAQPVADAAPAIQGRAAGVTVTQNSGGTSIRVRGVTSPGNNSPLYVVDGFPLPAGRWYDLRRTGELVTVLKAQGRVIQDFNRLLPIPQAEINVNPNLKQNTGY